MRLLGRTGTSFVMGLLVGALALGTGMAVAHNDGTEIRITAMRHESDGRIEFAVQERDGEGWGERILPRSRFFPATGREGRWLSSSPITVGVVEGLESAEATPTPAATVAPSSVGEWQKSEGANVSGDYVAYLLGATSHSGYSWQTPPTLVVRCGIGNDANDAVYIATPYLLHGGDNAATVNYRFAAESSATAETWWSNEDLDSAVFPNTSVFERRLAASSGLLYVEFVSLYDSDSHTATFDVTGATTVAAALTCF